MSVVRAGCLANHDELIAADACGDVCGAEVRPELSGDMEQEMVACVVPEGVVDVLEVVEVEEYGGEYAFPSTQELAFEVLMQRGSVVDAGESVVARPAFEFCFEAFSF